MSVKSEIYSLLVANVALKSLLAKSVIEGAELLPAIYDSWPGDNATMPYMICTYRFSEGKHWAQVSGGLDVDIFTDSGDTTEAENIKNIVLEALAWERIDSPTDGLINIYFGGTDEEIPEPEPIVTHWNINFLVKFWRQKLIAVVTNK